MRPRSARRAHDARGAGVALRSRGNGALPMDDTLRARGEYCRHVAPRLCWRSASLKTGAARLADNQSQARRRLSADGARNQYSGGGRRHWHILQTKSLLVLFWRTLLYQLLLCSNMNRE